MIKDILIYISVYVGFFAVIFYTLSLKGRMGIKEPVFPEKNPPFISIIIPAFNEERGIADTLESALNIDYPKNKMEIILVDDGSTDNTYKIALRFKKRGVKIFRKENGGKGSALNYGLKRAKGEIIFTMDADAIVIPQSAKYQVARFQNPKVMCVAPIVAVHEPKGILKKVQQIEYFLGVFLREAFTGLNAIHVTPGAFSAYRKSFFDKYGGFDENNLTEDLEMALRIQLNNYIIENSMKSVVYAKSPKTFNSLLAQRKRWYVGLIRNLSNYRTLFSKNYGALGLVVLPIAITTIILSISLTAYLVVRSMFDLKKEIIILNSINFNFLNTFELSKYALGRFLFNLFSNPIMLFMVISFFILTAYMILAKTKVKKYSGVSISIPLFIIFYNFLFTFWWLVSFFYSIFNKKVIWR